MLLWRICNIKEEQAILKNDFEKLTFGSPLSRYIKRTDINYYPQFDNMLEEVWDLKGDERIKPILKMFPYIPKEIPLFEEDEDKQKEIMDKFVPYNQYMARGLSENVFLNSIKVAGFFDTFWKVPYITQKSCHENHKLMAINIPDKIALKYKGYGKYLGDFVYPEYAIPLYRLKPEYLNLNKLSEKEYNKIYDKAVERGEKIFFENIFMDMMP